MNELYRVHDARLTQVAAGSHVNGAGSTSVQAREKPFGSDGLATTSIQVTTSQQLRILPAIDAPAACPTRRHLGHPVGRLVERVDWDGESGPLSRRAAADQAGRLRARRDAWRHPRR